MSHSVTCARAAHDELLTRAQVADLLKLRVQTLALWAMTGRHLPYIRVGGTSVRYRRSDVEAFLERRTVAASAE